MTEEEYNLDWKAQKREHQQRMEQRLQTIEKSLKSIRSNISLGCLLIIIILLVTN